jgi:aerobic-type carbon monoxide dehydrogenase small subunit (CoxS/CutS family)
MQNTVSAEAYVDVRLHVNGTVQALHVDSRVTLLDALRDGGCPTNCVGG